MAGSAAGERLSGMSREHIIRANLILCLAISTGGACDSGGQAHGDAAGADAGGVRPGSADKRFAVATAAQALRVDAAVGDGASTPAAILDQVGWLFGSASSIISAPASPSTRALPPPPPAPPAAPPAPPPGSASCDASGCVFAGYLWVDVAGAHYIVDGTIDVASAGADTHSLALGLMVTGLDTSSKAPVRYVASWTLSAGRLDGALHEIIGPPASDDDYARFDGVTFTDGQPAGGDLYARWTDAIYAPGGYEATVDFP
jgi:hypothetical protein